MASTRLSVEVITLIQNCALLKIKMAAKIYQVLHFRPINVNKSDRSIRIAATAPCAHESININQSKLVIMHDFLFPRRHEYEY